MNFKFIQWDKIMSWLAFTIALITYVLTLEPTTSFWDAGEYIATAANLEVGHPPGAPLYQMMGAFFASFAPTPDKIALLINFMSALASAFAVLFLFRSIGLLIRKFSSPVKAFSKADSAAIIASAFTGALSLTFTDSFWFNAVEAEVYAMSTFFMTLLFYLALLWERDMFEPRGNRWLILINLVVGLSFGVHFLTLLAIPAVGLLYYFKSYSKITLLNFIVANLVVVGVLVFIFKLLLPYTLSFLAASEIFFTNSFDLPYNSGTIIALLSIVLVFIFGLRYSRKRGYFQLNTLLLCILFILIGFSAWTMLPIRANANTVINENNPDNARELLAYYNREQYGELPLFYGPQFTEMYGGLDSENPYKDEPANYERDEESGRYIIINDYRNARYNFDDKHKTLLPRLWSREHAANYIEFIGGLDFRIKEEYQQSDELQDAVGTFRRDYVSGKIGSEEYHSFLSKFSEYLNVEKPSFSSNMGFMLEYQMSYMYWRYFLWNFVGRQNDIQGKYSDLNGNWLSGINVIDEMRLGPQDNLPEDMESNKARNTYFFLPLIIGLLGVVFHFFKDRKRFWVLTVFFLFTGLALKVYLNEYPFQVRERDYALVGSFSVFSMWIGIGCYALFFLLKRILNPQVAVLLSTTFCLLNAPILLASQNWDDHDRSKRYSALAMAKMYLDSVDKNAILFTTGDNDTFLLWYAQQVEGYRRDVRIVNTMLLGTDWYIDQMKRKAWVNEALPISFERDQYRAGTNDFIMYQPVVKDTLDINALMNWVASDDPRTIAELQSGRRVKTFPAKLISVPVNKENVLANGIVQQKKEDEILDTLTIEFKEDALYKNELVMLNILANNNWKRPIYFSGGSFGDADYLWMKNYLQLDGLTYKLVPIKSPIDPENPLEMGRIDTEKMYEIVTGWNWGNMGDPDIYHDRSTRRNSISYRTVLARLIEALLEEGEESKALKVLNLAMKNMPPQYYQYYFLYEPYIAAFFEVGEEQRATDLWEEIAKKYQENLRFYSNWKIWRQYKNADDIIGDIQQYHSLVNLLTKYTEKSFHDQKAAEFNDYLKLFPHFLK